MIVLECSWRTVWVRGRLARMRRCAPSRERRHHAIDRPARAERLRSIATGVEGE
jgi:hypothetical protein